jgi:hypothetical protein
LGVAADETGLLVVVVGHFECSGVSAGIWVLEKIKMFVFVEIGDYEEECKHKEQNQQMAILNTKLLTRLQRL